MSDADARPHRVELDDSEWELVRGLLGRARNDLLRELHKTDDRELREALRHDYDALDAVIGKLGVSDAVRRPREARAGP